MHVPYSTQTFFLLLKNVIIIRNVDNIYVYSHAQIHELF